MDDTCPPNLNEASRLRSMHSSDSQSKSQDLSLLPNLSCEHTEELPLELVLEAPHSCQTQIYRCPMSEPALPAEDSEIILLHQCLPGEAAQNRGGIMAQLNSFSALRRMQRSAHAFCGRLLKAGNNDQRVISSRFQVRTKTRTRPLPNC